MVSLCYPYDDGITCLCDAAKSVLRCFLSKEEGNKAGLTGSSSGNVRRTWTGDHSQLCERHLDTKTEIILAASISVLVILILTWTFISVRRNKRHCNCETQHKCTKEAGRRISVDSPIVEQRTISTTTTHTMLGQISNIASGGLRSYSLDTDLHTGTWNPDARDTCPSDHVYPVLTPYHLSAVSHPHVLMSVSNESDTVSEQEQQDQKITF